MTYTEMLDRYHILRRVGEKRPLTQDENDEKEHLEKAMNEILVQQIASCNP